MRVGFLSNQLDNRGTGNALFDYAHYNETILKNESKIFTFASAQHNALASERFKTRFGEYTLINGPADIRDIDVLYHIKYGTDEGFRAPRGIRYAVHSVFEIQPHGDRYAAVSSWLSRQGGKVDFVPHIVESEFSVDDYREYLGISAGTVVIGRHGGYDTFDIPWIWEAIQDCIRVMPWVYFLFINTQAPSIIMRDGGERVIFMSEKSGVDKRLFLNTCDAMLHARKRGETFGLAIGEFASLGKPVMTYALSGERAHIEELGDEGLYYLDSEDVYGHIYNLSSTSYLKEAAPQVAYRSFTPHYVMDKFKKVFLD